MKSRKAIGGKMLVVGKWIRENVRVRQIRIHLKKNSCREKQIGKILVAKIGVGKMKSGKYFSGRVLFGKISIGKMKSVKCKTIVGKNVCRENAFEKSDSENVRVLLYIVLCFRFSYRFSCTYFNFFQYIHVQL